MHTVEQRGDRFVIRCYGKSPCIEHVLRQSNSRVSKSTLRGTEGTKLRERRSLASRIKTLEQCIKALKEEIQKRENPPPRHQLFVPPTIPEEPEYEPLSEDEPLKLPEIPRLQSPEAWRAELYDLWDDSAYGVSSLGSTPTLDYEEVDPYTHDDHNL